MDKVLARIKAEIDEYREAYMSSLATANANHGAMQALERLMAELEAEEAQPAEETTE